MQNERKVVELPIQDVLPNRFQPRIKFDQTAINELAQSIKKYGVIQPIVVRRIGDKYEIIAGERRYKASVIAGKATIPAIISDLSDNDSVEIALIENVQREDLTPIEKAISYKKILNMGSMNQEELAIKVGKSQSAIANTLRLLALGEETQEALLDGKISERHARSLLKLKNEQQQNEMLRRIISERLTVRKTDEEIGKMFEKNNNEVLNNMNEVKVESSVFASPLPPMEDVVTIPDTAIIEPPVAPGFMDIEKIENTAQDIFVEKPQADIETLLQNASNSSELPLPQENDDLLQSGKFFNFFNEVEEPSAGPVPLDNNTDYSTFNFDSFFNFDNAQTVENQETTNETVVPTYEVPTMEIPVVEDAQEIPTMPEYAQTTYEVPTMEVPVVEDVQEVPSMPEYVQPTYEVPTMEIPVVEDVQEIPSMPEYVQPTYEVPTMEMPVVEEAQEVPVIPEYVQPTYEVPTMEVPVVEDVQEVPVIPEYVQPTYEVPTMEIPVVEEAQEVPVIPAYTQTLYEVPTVETINFEQAVVEEPDTIAETIAPTSVHVAKDIRSAINTVRECAETLEKYGFEVDMEEIDFEDTYQVIFKISK